MYLIRKARGKEEVIEEGSRSSLNRRLKALRGKILMQVREELKNADCK